MEHLKLLELGNQLPPSNCILNFLRQYKTVECKCCNQCFGFENRNTGDFLCSPDCSPKPGQNANAVEQSKLIAPPPTPIETDATPKIEEEKATINKNASLLKKVSVEPVMIPQDVGQPKKEPKIHDAECDAKQELNETIYEASANGTNPSFENVTSPSEKNIQIQKAESMNDKIADIQEKKDNVVDSYVKTIEELQLPMRKIMEVEPTKPYMWESCEFSKSLKNGNEVSLSFVWGFNKYQIFAVDDEPDLTQLQAKVQKYCKEKAKMTRKPIVDEIVLAGYEDEYYRARVMSVTENKCHLLFVDFGDEDREVDTGALVEVNEDIMSYPIYSATVELYGVPAPNEIPAFSTPSYLDDCIGGALQLELLEQLSMTHKTPFEAKLWLFGEDISLNKLITDAIARHFSEKE